ncbi:hypothetical protein IFR04_009981 [Cadophora malorum]|uniref:Uncharacterized protein n=1 Tax=Cadophora malorum TaxID=108018 RepID=A0A8H7TDN8_9HELO|nr:hypothetical protein IFR04_009981 [Cadophora malorum]
MAEVLGAVASVTALCSCAVVISNYALTHLESDVPAYSELMAEVTNLESSLNSLGSLIHASSEPLINSHTPASLSNAASQLKDTQTIYSTERIAYYFKILTSYLTEDPPPTLFILACIIYTLLFIRLRERYRDDQHQDALILSVVGLGIAASMYTRDLRSLMGYVAWCAIAGWMLSTVVHWVKRLKAVRSMSRISEPDEAVITDWKQAQRCVERA